MTAQAAERHIQWIDWDGIKLSQFQYNVITDPAKKMLVCAGRYTGKDWAIIIRFWLQIGLLYHARRDDPKYAKKTAKVVAFFIVPVSTTFNELWGRIKDFCPKVPGVAKNGHKHVQIWEGDGRWRIELFGGEIVVRCFSAFNPDALRGLGCDVLAISEGAFISEDDWESVISQVVIRPTFAGIAMINSTPLANWFDRAVDDALKGVGYWGRWSAHIGNSFSNPELGTDNYEEIMAIRAKNVYKYRREYLAELFVDVPDEALLGEGVTRAFAPALVDEALVTENFAPADPIYVVGIDLAMSAKSRDRLAIVVVEKRTGLVVYVETHESVDGIEFLMQIIGKIYERFKPQRIIYDAQGRLGSSVEGRLSRWRAEPMKVTAFMKYEFVTRLEQHLVARSVKLPHPELWQFPSNIERQAFQLLLREMRSYCRMDFRQDQVKNQKIHKAMMTTFHKPPGGSDDVLEALIFALHGIDVPKGAKVDHGNVGQAILSF